MEDDDVRNDRPVQCNTYRCNLKTSSQVLSRVIGEMHFWQEAQRETFISRSFPSIGSRRVRRRQRQLNGLEIDRQQIIRCLSF
jgi:hypothetical protein